MAQRGSHRIIIERWTRWRSRFSFFFFFLWIYSLFLAAAAAAAAADSDARRFFFYSFILSTDYWFLLLPAAAAAAVSSSSSFFYGANHRRGRVWWRHIWILISLSRLSLSLLPSLSLSQLETCSLSSHRCQDSTVSSTVVNILKERKNRKKMASSHRITNWIKHVQSSVWNYFLFVKGHVTGISHVTCTPPSSPTLTYSPLREMYLEDMGMESTKIHLRTASEWCACVRVSLLLLRWE